MWHKLLNQAQKPCVMGGLLTVLLLGEEHGCCWVEMFHCRTYNFIRQQEQMELKLFNQQVSQAAVPA